MKLILASSSPRRQELLKAARIPFTVKPSHVPEVPHPSESPLRYSKRLARDKAAAVWNDLPHKSGHVVLGADTIVVVDDHILEKPVDDKDATRMIRLIAGRGHEVISSVCLLGEEVDQLHSATTTVYVNEMTEQEIAEYVASGEPMDKAGAYGIQGMFSRWILRVDGEYPNVVGLPIAMTYRILRDNGVI